MLHIRCPHCQELRSEEEFACWGEAHIHRPSAAAAKTDQEWGEYLHFRTNPKGEHRELWQHTAGCRRFFNIARHTLSYQILKVYQLGEEP